MGSSNGDNAEKADGPVRQRRRASEQVRMTDVAARAGVSVMSVSRAIRDPERVSSKIRARVEKAMHETGYVPNALASSLASQRTRVIAAIVPFINASFGDTIRGITDVLHPSGYELLIGETGHSMQVEERLTDAFLSHRVDGLLLTGHSHTQGVQERLRNLKVPVVETWNLTDRPMDQIVGFSNYEAARAMTRYLVGQGRRHIGYLGGITQDNDRATDRERGYIDAMTAAGLPCDRSLRSYRKLEFRQGGEGCEELLERHPDIDAIFAASDMLAVGALFRCIKRRIGVPDDIAIAGFDDSDISSAIHPALTTVRVPRYEMGSRAAQMLLQRLDTDGETYGQKVVDLGFEILIRDST